MRYDTYMSKTIQVKGASDELRTRLENSAVRNFRSLNQEALARLQLTFDLEDTMRTQTHQAWIDEALAGKLRPGSIEGLKRIASRARAAR